jgi:hypothetical protein
LKGQLLELMFYPILAVTLFSYFYSTLANEVYEIKALQETIEECSSSLESSNLFLINSTLSREPGKTDTGCPIRRIAVIRGENDSYTVKELISPGND